MKNIDPSEIQKFSKLAAHWWDPEGELKTLHDINPLRLGYITQKCPLSGKKILDVGCGGGILSESMAKNGADVTGIDLSEDALNAARLHKEKSNISVEYILSSIEDFASTHKSQFDVITCMELLEHVPNPESIIRASATVLKPNGHLFLSTINRNLKSYLFAIVGAEYILKMLPQNTHDYAKFIRPSELSTIAKNHHLKIEDIIGITYNPFSKKYSLNTDISVNYIMLLRKVLC